MKRLIKVIVYRTFDLFFRYRFNRCIRNLNQNDKVYLVDIDNTLADTWPSLQNYVYHSENHRYGSLSIFIGMRNYILDKIKDQHKVVFISARSYLDYFSTHRWLAENGLTSYDVILVNRAEDKLAYIHELLHREIAVVYIDDLSYGHEYGEVRLYDKMILKLNALPVEYLGVKEIELINSAYATSSKSI
jgi:FMN phosphatase YigB (HAD superfamily)